MSDMVDIEWNKFIKICCDNYPDESCAFLFAKTPFQITEKWFVYPVDNIAEDKSERWIPDRKQMQRVKRLAKKQGFTKIGNIHSHPVPSNFKDLALDAQEKTIDYFNQPSEMDLKYACKVNDIVRGILVVDNKAVYAHCFHDQFGVPLPDLYLNGVNQHEIVLDVGQG